MDKDRVIREIKDQDSVRLDKSFYACTSMILGQRSLPDTIKTVIKLVCHELIEQVINDKIINDREGCEIGELETLEEKGATLYFLHTKFNQKLNRSDHIGLMEKDEFLLNCIVSEIKRRKEGFPDECREMLKEKIFERYCNMDFSDMEWKLLHRGVKEDYTDFDAYVAWLFKKERNGIIEVETFSHLWGLLGRKRDHTFRKRRPSKDELYMFCFALALDYKTFCQLKELLIKKLEEEGEKGSRKLKNLRDEDERDMKLQDFLRNIDSRLDIVRDEVNNSAELIPGAMLKNVNYNLKKKGFPLLGSAGKTGMGDVRKVK